MFWSSVATPTATAATATAERNGESLETPTRRPPRVGLCCGCAVVKRCVRSARERRRRHVELASLAAGDVDVTTIEGRTRFVELFALPPETTTSARDLGDDDRARLRRLFAFFDAGDNKSLSEQDLRVGLGKLGNAPSCAEANRLVAQLGNDGFLDFDDFVGALLQRKGLLYKALYTGFPLSGSSSVKKQPSEALLVAKARAKDPRRVRLSAIIAAQKQHQSPFV